MASVFRLVTPSDFGSRRLSALALALMLCALPGCALYGAGSRTPGMPDADARAEQEASRAASDAGKDRSESLELYEIGIASYYGRRFHGRRTASGEAFDMHRLTAAHRLLSFGTVLQVTNLSNGKSVKVRVNDRGPYVGGRVLDLSWAAAERIGMLHCGLAKVRIDVVAATE